MSTCISVTMIPSVTLASTKTNSRTDITISGLTGSDTTDADVTIYPSNDCTGAPTVADVHDSSNPFRAATGDEEALDANDQFREGAISGRHGLTDKLVSPSVKPKAWMGQWKQQEGTLTLRIGLYHEITAGEVVTFSFMVSNGPNAQSSRQVFASATGYRCKSNLCSSADHESVTIPPTPFDAVSSVLEIKPRSFEKAVISQSGSKPGETATITVTLKPNAAISKTTSEITLSGLCGTNSNARSVSILDKYKGLLGETSTPSTDNLGGSADWDAANKLLKIKVGATGLSAGSTYVFHFQWTLLEIANEDCSVSIEASDTAGNFAKQNMAGGVGKVDAPTFTTFDIGQISTRPGALNFICVTLKTNAEFNSDVTGHAANSMLTLSGLTGSQHATKKKVKIYECPQNDMQYGTNPYNLPTKTGWAMPISTNKPRQWTTTSSPTTEGNTGSLSPFEDDQFDFDATTGTAVFTMSSNPAAPKLTSKTVFALAMENSKTASECKTVTLTASGPDISQTVTMNSPAYQRALIDGEMDGDACPLKVYEPGFLTKIISSSNIVSDSANNLLVTLRSNVDLASDASFKSILPSRV